MKAILLLFDSLNRRMLPPYGCDWVHAPNFQQLAARSVTFDNAYVGSMPCMPARRELHTGRYNFLHRSWGPLEPYDDSLPELLRGAGVHTHLVSDHAHYWEDGGATYHQRYTTWEIVRGQEGDRWKAHVGEVRAANTDLHAQDSVNRRYQSSEAAMPQTLVFDAGLAFIERNHNCDSWFLQIETFDPHPPYVAPEVYRALYPLASSHEQSDWPPYRRVTETPEQVAKMRARYAALVSMCDRNLGRVLDAMDRFGLWDDTMLIVTADHGILLGEHDWWNMAVQPYYRELSQRPLFVWDPHLAVAGERRGSLVQTIDTAPTILSFFGVPCPADMQGQPLAPVITDDTPVRESGLFGIYGGQVNVTDGRYVYMRGPASAANAPLFEYTLMPAHMRALFSVDELRGATLHEPLPFTKGVPVLRVPSRRPPIVGNSADVLQTRLYDLHTDPKQEHPLEDAVIERRMIAHLVRLMQENDAPPEQFVRLGLAPPS
ncbi:MAG: sulfatase [Anaerolineae bacterium]